MRGYLGFCAGLVLASFAACAWTGERLKGYQRQADERHARELSEQRSIVQAAYAESLLTYKRDTVKVTRWATKYDTIRTIMDSVITDTVTTVPAYWVRGLIVASDSTISACRELVTSSGRALTACDSVQIALGRERDLYKNLYKQAKPSRLQKALPWIAGAAGFYVGAKLRVP